MRRTLQLLAAVVALTLAVPSFAQDSEKGAKAVQERGSSVTVAAGETKKVTFDGKTFTTLSLTSKGKLSYR